MTEDLFRLPKNAPKPVDVAKELSNMELPPIPPGLLRWLEKGKCIQENTIRVYSHVVSQFLAVMKITVPDKSATLRMAWDLALCNHFFETVSSFVCDSTLVNYHNALVAVRTYLKRVNQAPNNFGNLIDDFRTMQKCAIKKKKLYVNKRKESKQAHSGMLWLVYRRIYHNLKYVNRLYKIAERFHPRFKPETYVEPLTKEELFFANAFIMFIFFINNFHRAGNLTQIEYMDAKRAVFQARRKLGKRYGDFDINLCDRRLDRSRCEPAVIRVDDAMKSGGVIKFVLLSPRDQDLICKYFR